MNTTKALIDKLNKNGSLSKDEFVFLISSCKGDDAEYLFSLSRKKATENYGKEIFIRGLVEISNICKNDCFYCGIRKSNCKVERYRLSKKDILDCCFKGYDLGLRTFVLQGGEDGFFSDNVLCDIISTIKENFPDCCVTISLGERSFESYKRLFDTGAERYLLRHETATKSHYERLHPNYQTFERRMKCLNDLKKIGYQTGCGFMVGSPFQTLENIADDLLFIKEFKPEMVGIGPFIPQKDTPFGVYNAGSVDLTVLLLGIIRLMLPKVLLPATTALSTLCSDGRERGILAGANVVMPNLSPLNVREKYSLYNKKAFLGAEAAENLDSLKKLTEKIGYKVAVSRGDFLK